MRQQKQNITPKINPFFKTKTLKQSREKQQELDKRTSNYNPLFQPVRQFKKTLTKFDNPHDSVHSSKSGTSILNIHPKFTNSLGNGNHSGNQKRLLDLLNNQQSNGINPYLQILEEFYDEDPNDHTQKQTQRVHQLCYMGIGRGLVKSKQITLPSYSRANLLIRQFMLDPIQEQFLMPLKQSNPNHIYVESNEKCLGFKTIKLMDQSSFLPIVKQCNNIIEEQFLKFKKKKSVKVQQKIKWSSWINMIGIIMMIIYITLGDDIWLLMLVSWIFIICGVTLNLASLWIQSSAQLPNQNIILKIQKRLQIHLQQVNKREEFIQKYQWRCGKDFYWLQIVPLNRQYISA